MSAFQCRSHDWQWQASSPPAWTCTFCESTTHPCVSCGEPMTTSLTVCEACVQRNRTVLDDILLSVNSGLRLDPYWPLHSPSYDRDSVTTGEDDTRLPFGLDAYVTDPDDGRILACKTVPDALQVIDRWAALWAGVRDVPPPTDALEFLREHILWAMQNQEASQWSSFAMEVRQVRTVIRRLLGLEPVREPVPCVHCGGRIVRRWTDDGLDELRRCSGCGMEWAHEAQLKHTNYLVLRALPETHPDLSVTLEDAKRIYAGRVRPNLFDVWYFRGKVSARGTDVRGAATFRLGDMDALVGEYETRRSRAS